jgi:hypothetical protein
MGCDSGESRPMQDGIRDLVVVRRRMRHAPTLRIVGVARDRTTRLLQLRLVKQVQR